MFEDPWIYSNCIGSMNGKRILVKQPKHSGFYYFNYKGTFNIVLLALVDADYNLFIRRRRVPWEDKR